MDVVERGAGLHPASLVAEVDAPVIRRIDIARPDEAHVAVAEDGLGRPASEGEVDGVGRRHAETRPALHLERRRRRLVEFSLHLRDAPKGHGRVSRLEEDPTIACDIAQVLVAVEDVLEVQPGDPSNERGFRLRAVRQRVDSVVTGAVFTVRGVVTDDGLQVSGLERRVGHGVLPERAAVYRSTARPLRMDASAASTISSDRTAAR